MNLPPFRSSRAILSALALLVAAFAAADHNWRLDSYYDYSITSTSTLHDVEESMNVAGIDGAYGYGVGTSFGGGNVAQGHIVTNTYPLAPSFGDYYKNASQPTVVDSFLFGVIGDSGDQHLAVFVNDADAALIAGRSYESVFDATTYTEQNVVDAILYVHSDASDADKSPYYDVLNAFHSYAQNANLGGTDTGSLSFAPGSFSIVSFSDGVVLGGGTNTFTTQEQAVPEPASFAALSVGAVAVLRRRRR